MQRFNYEHEREQQAIDSHAIVSITNAQGDIIHVNDKFCRISGYSCEQLIGNNHRLLKSGQHPPAFYQQMWHTILAGKIWQGEICNRRKDGVFYWVKASIIPFLDECGKPYKYISYRTDISHIKRAEEKTRLLLESLGEGVFGVDLHLDCTFINSAAADMLGCRKDTVLGQAIQSFFSLSESDQQDCELVENPIAQTVADGKTRRQERLFRRNDGSSFPVDLTVTPKMYHGHCEGAQVVFRDISVRKQMERALSGSEERFRRAQNYANIGTWEWNIETDDLYWSERIAPLFGYPEHELETCYENFIKAVHPDDREPLERAIGHCFENNAPYFIEHRVVWPDGQIRWVSEHGDVVRDAAGKPIKMLGVIQDINARKLTEQQLKESEERLSVAIEGAGDGIWDWNMRTNQMEFSTLYAQMLGYQQSELKPRADTWINTIYPGDRDRVNRTLLDYLNGKIPKFEIEMRQRCKDHSWKWMLCRGKVVSRGRNNKPVRMTAIQTDISQRKKLEEKLLLFSHIFEVSEQFIGIADHQGFLTYVNPALCKRVGYRSSDIVGRHFRCLLPKHRRDQDAKNIMVSMETNKSWTGELPILCRNGSQFISSSNIGSITDQQGNIKSIFNIFSDFGDELKRRSELARAKDAAEQANQAKSEFLSRMSHELRTPLNAILGFAQILQFDDDMSMEQQESLHEIIKAGDHLLQLINEILDLAKIEAGHIDLSLEAVALHSAVQESVSLIEPLASARSISIANAIDAAINVKADAVRLKQVLLNLLSNAVKYNRPNGWIRIDSQTLANGYLRIMVCDNGIGVSEQRREELFQPFNRLDAEESGIEGTGIGLPITKRLIELMGGKIGVDSKPGEGSVFWVEMPVASAQKPASGFNKRITGGNADASVNVVQQVLCIDDNPVNIKLMRQILGGAII
nr:PAS domain S-box protein [Methylomarinum sp. Ch1-1]MDP4521832.1 PAS domain S-box protein [Methylomarinum sp. Ch1-1]